jgi:class 3 adenylate cyclase
VISVPTLVLHRVDANEFRVGHGRYLADHIPTSKYVELPGAESTFFAGDADSLLAEVEEFVTGSRSPPDPDRVLTTVLFTDVVSSTEWSASVGDRRWSGLLDAHDELAGRQLERYGGRIVKTTGDGLLAAFDGPARAIKCACAIRDALRALGLVVRAGIHTGEVEGRGTDLAGIAVHLASRVQAQAAPGEVVVSRTVVDLVAGSGIEFDDRGEHELKGFPGKWRLFTVNG